ncbi:MAG: DsbA family protein [Leptolyngbya sp. BL-A-14]
MSHEHNGTQLVVPLSKQDHIQGNPKAAVVLVEYGNYQCRHCGEIDRIIQQIQQQLNVNTAETKDERLCFVFRHFPNTQLHPRSQRAAEAAETAAAQGLFWPMHHALFKHQYALSDGCLVEYADQVGLNVSQFLQEMSSRVYTDRVRQDVESGKRSGVTNVPTLFLNGDRYTAPWTFENLLTAILEAETFQSL